MRGKKVKSLRTEERSHPGRKKGGEKHEDDLEDQAHYTDGAPALEPAGQVPVYPWSHMDLFSISNRRAQKGHPSGLPRP